MRHTYEFAGWGGEAKYIFKREPAYTASLDDGKVLVVCSLVTVFVDTGQWRHRVDCQRYRWDDDEQHRYDRQHLTNNTTPASALLVYFAARKNPFYVVCVYIYTVCMYVYGPCRLI